MKPRKRRLSGEARRALELLLAVDQRGTTEALMLAHGFTYEMLARLVHAGLATWYREAVKAGDRTIEVSCLMITAAGRTAIEG